MNSRFPKAVRLRTRQHYKRLMHSAHRFSGRWVCIDFRYNNSSHTRLGITVTRRYGKAHERNRFKRIVRETFRQFYPQLPIGFDLNVRPRTEAAHAVPANILEDLINIVSSIKKDKNTRPKENKE